MAFIQLPTQPITPPVLTKAQQLKRDPLLMKAQGGTLLKQLKDYAGKSLATVWRNDTYTAQEFLNQLGTKAGEAMQQHSQLIAFLASQGVSVDISMVKAYAVSEDGSVTVSE